MYRSDSGEILIRRLSFFLFFFFLWKTEVSELIWARSAAHWGWPILLAVAERIFRGPQFSIRRVYIAALLCWASSHASPRVSTFVIPTGCRAGCLMAPQNRHKDQTVMRDTVWNSTNLTRSESPLLRPSKVKDQAPVPPHNPPVWPNTRNSFWKAVEALCKGGIGLNVGCLGGVLGLSKSI